MTAFLFNTREEIYAKG